MKVTNLDFIPTEFQVERHGYTYRIFRTDGLWSASVSMGECGECARILLIMKPKSECIAAVNEHIKLYGGPEE